MKNINLRIAEQDDEQFVNDLTRETMRPYVEETWSDEVSREEYYKINSFQKEGTQIVCENNQAIGRITITEKDKEILLDEIHLIPEVQGRGIGSKLLCEVIKDAIGKKKAVSLTVLKTNPVKTIYERLGFEVYQEKDFRYFMKKSV